MITHDTRASGRVQYLPILLYLITQQLVALFVEADDVQLIGFPQTAGTNDKTRSFSMSPCSLINFCVQIVIVGGERCNTPSRPFQAVR